VLVLGVMAGTDNLLRAHDVAGRDPKMFYIVPLTDMLLFGTFIYFAFRSRSNPSAHKRYILLASTALLVAAIARLPIAFLHRKNPIDGALSDIFLLALVAYHLWSTRKIHRATLWSGIFLMLCNRRVSPSAKPPFGTRLPLGSRLTHVEDHSPTDGIAGMRFELA